MAPAHGPRHSYTAGELVLHHAFAPSVAQPDDPDRAACQLQVRPRPARAQSARARNWAAHKAPRRRPGGPGRRRSSPGFTTWSQSAQARTRGRRWWWPRFDAGRATTVVQRGCSARVQPFRAVGPTCKNGLPRDLVCVRVSRRGIAARKHFDNNTYHTVRRSASAKSSVAMNITKTRQRNGHYGAHTTHMFKPRSSQV